MSIYDLCLDCNHERQRHEANGVKCAAGDCLCRVGYRSRVKFRLHPQEWHARNMRTNSAKVG